MTRTAATQIFLAVLFLSWLHGCGGSGNGASGNDPFGLRRDDEENGGSGGGGGAAGEEGDENFVVGEGGRPVVAGCNPALELCVDAGVPGFCSDSQLDVGEVCDDGNTVSGDGCTATCAIEANFVCPTPGDACVTTIECGDGLLIAGAEMCDDGNTTAGDGCSDVCLPEPGWSCPIQGQDCIATACGDGILAGLEECEDGALVPVAGDGCDTLCQVEAGAPGVGGAWQGWTCETVGAACVPTTCNDSLKEGDEPCDDGNQIIGDGCNVLCEVEPECPPQGGACTSPCGDGMILPGAAEDCDDGNTADGDGCSSVCAVEPGYMCALVEEALPASITLPFVFRDFVAYPSTTTTMQRHPDFQNGCLGTVLENMTNNALDVDGKPTNSGACVLPAACVPDVDYTAPAGDTCLDRDGCAATGCQRSTHPNHPLAAHPGIDPFYFWYRDTPDVNVTLVVPTLLMGNNGVYSFTPGAFFPMNNQGWVLAGEELAGNGGNNFGFTSEVHYWFQFQGGEALTFAGDDDLFVFANGQLVLPIGSKHNVTNRTVIFNADGTATCATCATMSRNHGMTVGNVYEAAIFHAERQAVASNFNLSITGFVKAKSECVPVCGDGAVTPDEECDNGAANDDAAYNGCTLLCNRGPSCGDGVVNGPEACDDSVNLSDYGGCAPGCVLGPSCGDGIVQSAFEECDDGVLAAMYGGCAPTCILGPRCGDGVVQFEQGGMAQEQCDDGNRRGGDGCDGICKEELIE